MSYLIPLSLAVEIVTIEFYLLYNLYKKQPDNKWITSQELEIIKKLMTLPTSFPKILRLMPGIRRHDFDLLKAAARELQLIAEQELKVADAVQTLAQMTISNVLADGTSSGQNEIIRYFSTELIKRTGNVFYGDRPVSSIPACQGYEQIYDLLLLGRQPRADSYTSLPTNEVVSSLRPELLSAMEDEDYSPPTHFCNIYAEMDHQVLVNRVTTLEVVISFDKLHEWIQRSSAQTGRVEIDSCQHFTVQVVAKTNFVNVDVDRVEVDPVALATDRQKIVHFDLRATHLGEGIVLVILRQGQLSLLTLTLKTEIIQSRVEQRSERTLSRAATLTASSVAKAKDSGFIDEMPTLSSPLHQLRIFEKRNGSQISYLYELHSPSLDILESYESEPIHSDRHAYVENLYNEIESRWFSNGEDVEAFTAELRAFGGHLFDQLFPQRLQQRLWNHRHEINSIMVISTEPFVPWELVHLKEPGKSYLPDEVRFLGQMGLIRWLHDAGWAPEQITIRRSRIRYVIPQYHDPKYRLPQAEVERQFLETMFQARAVEARSTPVRDFLSYHSFDLLHVACHGFAEQGNIANAKLMMEGKESQNYAPTFLSATTVEQYCKLGRGGNRPIVVLNACQVGRTGPTLTGVGGFARAFLKGGAGVFVGPLWSVGDRPARMFAEVFYSGLLEGLNLAEATTKARNQTQQAGDATWLAYTVYGHPHMKIVRQEQA